MPFRATRAPCGRTNLNSLKRMLGSNDISNDAKSNGHANVTDLTLDKAHRGRYMAPLIYEKGRN